MYDISFEILISIHITLLNIVKQRRLNTKSTSYIYIH